MAAWPFFASAEGAAKASKASARQPNKNRIIALPNLVAISKPAGAGTVLQMRAPASRCLWFLSVLRIELGLVVLTREAYASLRAIDAGSQVEPKHLWSRGMWTLIMVTLVVSGAATGGVSATTSFLDFPDEAKCRAAADAMAGTNQVVLQSGTRPISPSAIYRIITQCVER